jgi:inosine-uridine nucleoside N-ribohydrolase
MMPGALIIDSDGGWDDAFATALLAGDMDGSASGLRLITSVGGINDQKGGADLLDAVSRFVTSGTGSAVEVVVGGGKLAAEAGKQHLDASDWGITYREDCRQLLSHFDGRSHGSTAAATATTSTADVDTGGKNGVNEEGGSADAAAGAILRAVEESRAAGTTPVTLLALGPLTNIAALVRHASPATLASIHLIVMGGAVRVDGNAEGNAEFNFRLDIEAAQDVIHCR